MKKLLLVALVCAGVVPVALGQTGRIAHFSHAGRVAVSLNEEGKDNFGYPARVEVDSIHFLSAGKAIKFERVFGQGESGNGHTWSDTITLPGTMTPQTAAKYLRSQFPEAKLTGFDKQFKKPSCKKPTNRTQAFPKRPFQYSYWRELSAVVALGAVGWLLGKKRPA